MDLRVNSQQLHASISKIEEAAAIDRESVRISNLHSQTNADIAKQSASIQTLFETAKSLANIAVNHGNRLNLLEGAGGVSAQ